MFLCQFCNEQVPSGMPCNKIVVEKRVHRHPVREKWDEKKRKWILLDAGGTGLQIVREMVACPSCAKWRGS